MAFVTQTPVVVGEPTKASTPNTIIDNGNDLNARLSLIENEGIPNGSFEFPIGGGLNADGWTATDTSTGSHSVDTAIFIDGRQSFKAVADASGGFVTLINNTYSQISGVGDDVFVRGNVYATAAARIRVEAKFYDGTFPTPSLIATQTLMDTNETALPILSAWHRLRGWARAPSGARFWRLNVIFGDGTVAADIYVDGLDAQINAPYGWVNLSRTLYHTSGTSSGTFDSKIPIVGRAYAARIRCIEVGAGTNPFYMQGYRADAATYSQTSGLWEGDDNPNAETTRELDIQCGPDGATRYFYNHAGAGNLTLYYAAWR